MTWNKCAHHLDVPHWSYIYPPPNTIIFHINFDTTSLAHWSNSQDTENFKIFTMAASATMQTILAKPVTRISNRTRANHLASSKTFLRLQRNATRQVRCMAEVSFYDTFHQTLFLAVYMYKQTYTLILLLWCVFSRKARKRSNRRSHLQLHLQYHHPCRPLFLNPQR